MTCALRTEEGDRLDSGGQRRDEGRASGEHGSERHPHCLLAGMSLLEVIVYLIIAGICGAIGGAIAGGTPGGFIVSVVVGFVGAYLGTWIARQLHLPELWVLTIGGHPFPIVWSIIGAIVLVAILNAIMRPIYIRRSAA